MTSRATPTPAPLMPGAAPEPNAVPDLAPADAMALARMHAVDPVWRGLALAGDVIRFPKRTILHAGPPVAPASLPVPLAHSAAIAALYEGWAPGPEEALAQLRSGAIRLAPAQDHRAMVPLAAVLSPNMAVQVVVDRGAPDRAVYSPLNGGTRHEPRLGLAGAEVLAHLRWLNGNLAATLSIAADRDVPLIPLADASVHEGDDAHGRTPVGSARTIATLAPRLGSDTPERRFLDRSPGIFLTLWMAAAKCIALAGEGPGSSLVTAIGGNGAEVGLQLGGLPGRWFTAPATPPEGTLEAGACAEDRLGVIGDSALVDALGFGAMLSATPAAALLPRRHQAFRLTGLPVGLPARRVVESGLGPAVALGILDRSGTRGRIGGGLHHPPLSLFAEACRALASAP